LVALARYQIAESIPLEIDTSSRLLVHAMVQRFIKDVDGAIKLTNWQPHGACVSLLLPKKCLAGNKL
jgi:hypothetical protein